jgi:putative ABC transport system permease protein
VPIVAALAGRPPAPKTAGRLVIPIGVAFLAVAFILLGLAGAASGQAADGGGGKPLPELALGIVLLAVAVIMLAPTALGAVAWLGRGAPISVRLALSDLSRYRARSGPALAAIALATLIAVLVCVEGAGRLSNPLDYAGPNLTPSQLAIYPAGGPAAAPIPLTPAQQARLSPIQRAKYNALVQAAQSGQAAAQTASQARAARQIAGSLGNARILTLDTTGAALTHAAAGRNWNGPIYLATPQLLRLFGISPSQVRPDADILTMRPGLSSLSLMQLQYGSENPKASVGPPAIGNQYPCPAGSCLASPPIQEVSQLPSGTSAPNTVLTEHALRVLHLQSTVSVAGWLVQAPAALTPADIRGAQQAAAAAGLSVETRNSIPSLSTIVNDATIFGILLALAILGMSVGLVRSEAARDLRTLAATGASGTTRRILVATTAGALGFTGALIGAAGGYLAAIGFARTNQLDALSSLASVPVANLLLILVGMPVVAAGVSWLLTLRGPAGISRQPLE